MCIPLSFLYPFLCSSKEKGEKKRRPVKSLFPRSLHVFREVKNSRAIGTLEHPTLLIRKTLAHPGLFKGVSDTYKKRNPEFANVLL